MNTDSVKLTVIAESIENEGISKLVKNQAYIGNLNSIWETLKNSFL